MMKRNSAISFLRVAGMMMIIGCHLASWIGVSALAQLLNVGVPIFLLISGFLYGNKVIDKPKQWMSQRFLRIATPTYIFLIVLVGLSLIAGEKEVLRSLPGYLLFLEGFGFITNFNVVKEIQGGGQLWFLTVILLCYLLVLLAKRIEKKYSVTAKSSFVTLTIGFILILLLNYAGLHLNYFFIFFVGYAIAKYSPKTTIKSYIGLTILMLLGMALRLISRNYIDNTILYNNIVTGVTHDILALWIFYTVTLFSQKQPVFMQKLTENHFWIWLDSVSFDIYITHYVFLTGAYTVDSITQSKVLGLVIFTVGTVLSAVILHAISNVIIKKISTHKKTA